MGGLVRPEDRTGKEGPYARAGKARGKGRAGVSNE